MGGWPPKQVVPPVVLAYYSCEWADKEREVSKKKSVYYLLVETNNVTFISIRMTNVAFLYVQKPLAAEVAKTGCKWKNWKIQTQESVSVRE